MPFMFSSQYLRAAICRVFSESEISGYQVLSPQQYSPAGEAFTYFTALSAVND